MTEVSAYSASSTLVGGTPKVIDHTPDENEFKMILIPSTRIIFMGADIGVKPITVLVTLSNETSLMQAFKVKCTANKMFTIKPAYGIITPKEKKKTLNMHPREILAKYKAEGVKRIQCQFKDASGQPIHPANQKSAETLAARTGDSSTTHSEIK
uniref:Major sperm protein n=1 Tax=Elaeophora elaphi TaxID=1147741 RepID=A0A0R3RH12_9BILA